jgi:prepilin-type N-terminal cleavage/methylation domain-containing protein
MKRGRRIGLTLVEVLIAIAILAIGILAALGLQSSALAASRQARIVQELTKIAEAELSIRRTMVSDPNDVTCVAQIAPGFTCGIIVTPCVVAVGGSFTCATGTTGPVAHRLTVTATGPGSRQLTVTGLVALPPAALPPAP